MISFTKRRLLWQAPPWLRPWQQSPPEEGC